MIDPKLNEVPVANRTTADRPASETDAAERQRRSRAGLSITDTIAGDTLLSTGGRGVDTSGVASGAGAGAGTSVVTPGQVNESPAPNIVPGARSSGTTPRSRTNQNDFADSARPEVLGEGVNNTTGGAPNTMEVAHRAYEIWCSKGCPEGTADEDWWQAERELEIRSSGSMTTSAGR
jgi:hypothetical protein